MSAERRRRPSAASARAATQPYPTDPRIKSIQAWVASLADAPQPQLGHLASNTVEPLPPPTPTPTPPTPPPPTIQVQHPSIPLLAVGNGWAETGIDSTDFTDYHVQRALASALQLPLVPPADYSNLARDVRMKEPWERSTVASTMHTASMHDWNAEADAGSEFETMSDVTTKPSRDIGGFITVHVPAIPPQEEGEKERKGEGEEGSDYAPSSRSVTPPPRVQSRPRRTPRNTKTTKRPADLDEEYDEKDIDLDAAISGEPSEPKAKKRRYVSSTTAVEDHSARSSPRESLSPSPPPPPPSRRKGVLRGKVARRANFRPTAHFGSRDASGSESA